MKTLQNNAALATIALCLAFAPATATYAQDAATEEAVETDAGGIDEIVVTANKRAESLQDVPLAISAVGGDDLADRGIDDVSNLQSYVPNLRVGQEQDGFKISLRGIGLQGTSSINDSGVAFYIDNFYQSRPAGGSAVFYDVNRVEVLRGPQGTLYGRNATGGVLNVISNEPTNDFEGEVGASYGSRDFYEARGFLNVPLGDVAAARISAVYSQEDGYVKNLSGLPDTDNLLGSDGDLTVRGQMLFGDPETIEVLLYGVYSKINGTGVAQQFLERNIGGPPPTRVLLATIPADDNDPLTTSIDTPSYNDTETKMGFVRVIKDFGGVEAYLQAGKLWQESAIQQDFDGSPVNVAIFNKDQDNEAESLEFRLSSDRDGPFTWIVGAYYFNEDTFIVRRVRLRGRTPGGIIQLPDFLLEEEGKSSTIAAFASATFSLTDALRITGGIRYTKDEKSGTKTTLGNFGQPFPPNIPNATFPGEVEFDKVTWKGSLEYDIGPDILAYASISNGYKAGGFNLTSNGSPYNPETITAYELGFKSDLFDRRARINVDAFYYDYADLQLTTLATVNGAPGQLTSNAAQSTIWGVEIDTQWELAPELLFTASYAYINAEFDEYFNRDERDPAPVFNPGDPSGLGRTNLSGNRIPFVAEHTINLGLQYETTIGNGTFTAAVNTNFHSDVYLREYNNYQLDRVPANTKTDISVSYRFADPGLKITGYVTNLEDNVERNNIYVSPGFIGSSATTSYTKPRTIGIRVDYGF